MPWTCHLPVLVCGNVVTLSKLSGFLENIKLQPCGYLVCSYITEHHLGTFSRNFKNRLREWTDLFWFLVLGCFMSSVVMCSKERFSLFSSVIFMTFLFPMKIFGVARRNMMDPMPYLNLWDKTQSPRCVKALLCFTYSLPDIIKGMTSC